MLGRVRAVEGKPWAWVTGAECTHLDWVTGPEVAPCDWSLSLMESLGLCH